DEDIPSTLPTAQYQKLLSICSFDPNNTDISELVNRYLTFDNYDPEELDAPTTQMENIEYNENRENNSHIIASEDIPL
ncbi:24199_t:CDS:2, partial [Gigaspora margarita]